MQNITERFSSFIAGMRYEDLPQQVIEQTKLFIADYYAACIAGFRVNTVLNEKALLLMRRMGGCGESRVLFGDVRLPSGNAAFMNSLYAHGADMDDGNRKAAGHIGAHVISAVFAMAEASGAAWKDVILAIVAGYEAFNRVAGAAQPSLYAKGFHSTGVGGGIACAAACAKLMNLDANGIYNAISLGALQSSGLIMIDESGQCCKPINPANAARTGIFSAQLAQLGLESCRNPLESGKGWFNAFSDSVDEEVLLGGLGDVYTICESYLKLYPACRHTHCCIDGILAIRERMQADGTLGDIGRIEVRIYPNAIKSAGRILRPGTADEAKFSIHYCISAALAKGKFGLDELEVSRNQEVLSTAERITLIPDEAMENRSEGIRGCRVSVYAANGKCYQETVLIPKGEAKKPLTWADMRNKIRECAAGASGEAAAAGIVDELQGLDVNAPFAHLKAVLEI